MKKMLLRSSALIALAIPAVAQAQSTGSVDFDKTEIVVSGARVSSVGGVEVPDSPKAKEVLDEEIIRRQRPGQTVNDIVNLVPGVSFQNNDPWGSSGGGFTIRGFSADRVSQTLDGLPLNDSGNYALYTNQQVDPEVLESVNVNLGSTDVDSPTASASGGTINIRTRVPGDDFGIVATMTTGNIMASGVNDKSPYMRGFVMVDTGDITGMGTKAFLSASYTQYDVPYNPYGKVRKQQYNGRLYQDIGSNGDFVSVAFNYNENRNNFAGSERLSDLLGYYDGTFTKAERFDVWDAYAVGYPCTVPDGQILNGGGTNGVSERYDDRNGCGAPFYRRYNPSNTGNIRGTSRFTLADGLVLTVDPSFQYVKANGGGPDDLREAYFTPYGTTAMLTGAFNGGYYYGRDLNGDGDMLDRIAGTDPSHTQTRRYGVVANLIYNINSDHRIRIAYTLDHARHRQTGYVGWLNPNGEPSDVFPINDPLLDVNGYGVSKRNRLSYAILNQVSGEYRGHFGPLTATLGLRMPFFTRKLNQYCYTTSISGYVDCPNPGQDLTAYEAANPDYAPPQSRTYNYNKPLPNIGLTYEFANGFSAFGSYSKGLSVPGTDPLYDSLYLPDSDFARPVPETTDSFDLGARLRSGGVTAQVTAWYTRYNNRLATAFDPEADEGNGAYVYRNLGRVDKWGFDGSIAYSPSKNTLIYLFGSINRSDIKADVQSGTGTFLATAGKSESGAPSYSFGARGQVALGDLELGAQVKRTGPRWVDDQNTLRVPAYTLVDFDARYRIADFPTGGQVAVQLNVTNIFDQYYVGYFGGSLTGTSYAQIGAPRAASISLVIGY